MRRFLVPAVVSAALGVTPVPVELQSFEIE
jgi:hypothetical protein